MKTTHLLLRFVCLLTATVELSGCGDHISPGSLPDRLRVKTLTQVVSPNAISGGTTSMTTASAFTYDLKGRLASISTYQTPDSTAGPVEKSVYQYDSLNRFTQLRRDIRLQSPDNRLLYEVYQYSHNAASQVSGINYTNNNSGTYFNVGLGYNGNNQVIGSDKSFSFAPLSYRRTQTYSYTGNNLTGVVTSLQASFLPGGTGSTTYTHDTKINPFYGVYLIPAPILSSSFPSLLSGIGFFYYTYYGGFDNLLNLSQNNVLTAGPEITYAYTYNSANLPTSRVTTTTNTTSNTSAVTETLYYAYESY